MKIKINIDCTPEEARRFLGLPDVKPYQDAMLNEMQAQAEATMKSMTPEAMISAFFPQGMQGLEDIQKMFWDMATGNGAKPKKNK